MIVPFLEQLPQRRFMRRVTSLGVPRLFEGSTFRSPVMEPGREEELCVSKEPILEEEADPCGILWIGVAGLERSGR